jgi:hypothetical protein
MVWKIETVPKIGFGRISRGFIFETLYCRLHSSAFVEILMCRML